MANRNESGKQSASTLCSHCGTVPVEKGRRLYCGAQCASEAQVKQLQALGQRRRAISERNRGVKVCKVCGAPFASVRSTQVYCSVPCQAQGLVRAIERQRQRRVQARQAKATEATVKQRQSS